jgi:hypothetical protein
MTTPPLPCGLITAGKCQSEAKAEKVDGVDLFVAFCCENAFQNVGIVSS